MEMDVKPEPEPEPEALHHSPHTAQQHSSCVSPGRPGYLLCRLPEVARVREPAVQLGQLLQHVGQLSEGGPVPQVVGPAGREDFLRVEAAAVSEAAADPRTFRSADSSTHCDLLAEADLCQDLPDALTAAHLPDSGLHWLVGDWPVPRLELIPNGA